MNIDIFDVFTKKTIIFSKDKQNDKFKDTVIIFFTVFSKKLPPLFTTKSTCRVAGSMVGKRGDRVSLMGKSNFGIE